MFVYYRIWSPLQNFIAILPAEIFLALIQIFSELIFLCIQLVNPFYLNKIVICIMSTIGAPYGSMKIYYLYTIGGTLTNSFSQMPM